MSGRLSRPLLIGCGLALVWTALILATGGFTVRAGGMVVRAHTIATPLVIATALLLGVVTIARRSAIADLTAGWLALARSGHWIAVAVALIVLAVGIRWNTWAAGGSDSYCYISQAALFASGRAIESQPYAEIATWPGAETAFVPSGYVPGPRPWTLAPKCPPGLSLIMAAAAVVAGPRAMFIVVPLAGALLVWLTFKLAALAYGAEAGVLAAALLAASPVFLYQVVQPMSDVPAAAAWLLAAWLAMRPRALPLWSGVAAGLAVLIRPNLLPLAGLIGVAALMPVSTPEGVRCRTEWPAARRRIAWFALGLVPACIAIAALNAAMHGSPLRSGYGALGSLFNARHVPVNVARYARWVIETQTPLILLAPLALFARGPAIAGPAKAGPHRRVLLALAAATIALYLPYTPFEEWWYLRFLLPAVACLLALTAVVVSAALSRLPAAARLPSFVVIILVMVVVLVRGAIARQAFELQRMERRYVVTGEYVARALPRRAALLAIHQSGSLRHYASRPTIAWDGVAPRDLDVVFRELRRHGYAAYLVLESWEEPAFRARFGGHSKAGALDWPPRARIGHDVRVYDPEDRRRYLEGNPVRTETVWVF